MANVSEKFGLRPYRKLDGTPLVGAQNRYTIASGYATAIFQGDLVIPKGTGNIERYDASGAAGLSTAVVGVFNGCFYTDPTTQKPTFKNFYPGGIAASDITDLYKNYAVNNTTGVTQTGLSKVQLDVSNSGTTVSFVLQAIDICQDPDNSDTATSNANILVRINHHQYRSRTGIA